MRKIAFGLASCLALAGCDDAALFLPMTPTRASIAAPRRPLADDEKDAISDAVLRKLGDGIHRDFTWFPLVVRPHDGVVDYCGLISGDDVVGEYNIQDAKSQIRDYLAELTFDPHGKLAKVDVVAVGERRSRSIPTQVDSTCLQDDYDIRR